MNILKQSRDNRTQLNRIQNAVESQSWDNWYINHWKQQGYFKYNRKPPKFIFSQNEINLMIYGSNNVLEYYYRSYGANFFDNEYEFLANVIFDTLGKKVSPSQLESYIQTFRIRR